MTTDFEIIVIVVLAVIAILIVVCGCVLDDILAELRRLNDRQRHEPGHQ